MARGRPALATVLMTTGIVALAVPGSVTFAGEFLILAGVYGTGWGWAVVGAVAIVLAAMYMLRLISAVLHGAARLRRARGRARPAAGELAIVVPLVALVLFLSAWPALDRASASFPQHAGGSTTASRAGTVIQTPKVDWFALSPTLALLGALGRRAARQRARAAVDPARRSRRFVALAGFVDGGRPRRDRLRRQRRPEDADRGVVHARPARRAGGDPVAGAGAARGPRLAGASGAATTRASTTRSSPRPARAWPSSSRAGNLMTLFLGLEWFSISLYILCALDTHRAAVARGRAQVPRSSARSAPSILLFGSALVYGATGELGFSQIATRPARATTRSCSPGLAMMHRRPRRSRPPRRRSTCGRPTSTRARRPR